MTSGTLVSKRLARNALLVFFSIFACVVSSQQPKKQQSSASVSPAKQAIAKQSDNYLRGALQLVEGAPLPANFVGHSPEDVTVALAKLLDLKKGEFETSAQFENRKNEALIKPILGTLTLENPLLFTVGVRKHATYSSGISYSYDADKQQLSLFVIPLEVKPNGIGGPSMSLPTLESTRANLSAPGLSSIGLTSEKVSSREYTASNAYGATVRVTESAYRSVELGSSTPAFIPKKTGYGSAAEPAIIISMPVDRAQTLLPSLRALLVAKSLPPYIQYNFVHSAPTRDAPSEFSSQQRIIRADIEQIWFFVPTSGEVVAVLPAR